MTSMTLKESDQAEALENTMNCARWLVREFENINCDGIAVIFDRAISDAETWVQTMVEKRALPEGCSDSIRAHEAAEIHNILIRYASIDNPDIRKKVLERMSSSTTINSNS